MFQKKQVANGRTRDFSRRCWSNPFALLILVQFKLQHATNLLALPKNKKKQQTIRIGQCGTPSKCPIFIARTQPNPAGKVAVNCPKLWEFPHFSPPTCAAPFISSNFNVQASKRKTLTCQGSRVDGDFNLILMVQKSGINSPVEGKVVYPISYKVFYMPGGCFGFLKHQQYTLSETNMEPENGWSEDEFL